MTKTFFLGLRYKKDTLLFKKKNIFFGRATLLFKYSIHSIAQVYIKMQAKRKKQVQRNTGSTWSASISLYLLLSKVAE